MNMRTKKWTLIVLAILVVAAWAISQEARTDQVTVPLSNPGKPARVKVNAVFGTIRVVGYEGKDVVIEAKPREKSLSRDRSKLLPELNISGNTQENYLVALMAGTKGDKEKAQEKKEKTAGMKQIPLDSSGLTAEEENNAVTVHLESWRRAYDLELKVPFASSLNLSGASLDAITVENVNGEIEANTTAGNVKLVNVAGPLTVSATNGDIEAVLTKSLPDKPMSFVSFHGDIDLTLPADAKASFRIKSTIGELYSDFDIALKSMPVEPEKTSTREAGRLRVRLERSVYGTINGGGPEFRIQNNSGDIYIRKKK
jgi:hypothetical protein